MSGPQFIHFQTFARKPNKSGQSVEQVLEEARRTPEYSQHVEAPREPKLIFGAPVGEVASLHEEMLAAGAVDVKLQNGKTVRRGIRKDRHTLLTAVASHPYPCSLIASDEEAFADYERWKQRNVRWLKEMFGDRLVSIIEHVDETHPHIHAFVLPLGDPACEARNLNPAWVAKERAMAEAIEAGHERKAVSKLGNAAYRAKGREIQDAYYAEVGLPCGLTRTGPKRRRLSRAQWKAEKEAARLGAQVEQDLEARMLSLIEAEDGLDQSFNDKVKDLAHKLDLADQALADAEHERVLAREKRSETEQAQAAAQQAAQALITQAKEDAAAIRRGAESEIERQRRQLVEQNATQLEDDRALLYDAEAKATSEARRLEAARHRLSEDHDRQVRAAVQEAVQLSMKLLLGVLDGGVRQNPETKGWIIEDAQLREQSRSLKLTSLIGQALTAFRDTWDRLKSKLADAEHRATREQVEKPIKEATKTTPPSRGFQP